MGLALGLDDADDARLDAYHREWKSGGRPSLWGALSAARAAGERPLLVLMILRIDLEHRLRAGDAAPLVEELFAFPETHILGDPERLELIEQEYQGRWQRGEQRVRRAEYQQRFPDYASAIETWRPRWDCPSCGAIGNQLTTEDETRATCANPRCREVYEVAHLFTAPPELPLGHLATGPLLGEGGMGEVFEGRDPALDRVLAIKVIHQALQGDATAERRFLREAQITGRLQHPSIVPIHGLGRLPDGRLYYSMKRVRGRTLAAWLQHHDLSSPGACPPNLVAVLTQVCEAIAFAHDQGVIHRDLKPSNIMVGDFGEVQVMDWGLARWLSPSPEDPPPNDETGSPRRDLNGGLTAPGAGVGTLLYMPPEQAPGSDLPVGKTADVFALGAILCEILTGLPPYQDLEEIPLPDDHPDPLARDAQQRALRQRWVERAALGDTSPGQKRLAALLDQGDPASRSLVELARDCLRASPTERPPDAQAVVLRLRAHADLLRDQANAAIASEAKRDELARRLDAERRARRRLTAAALVAGLSLVGGIIGIALIGYQINRRTRAERDLVTVQRDKSEAQARATQEELRRVEAERARTEVELHAARRASHFVHAQRMTEALNAWNSGRRDQARLILQTTDPSLRGWEWHYLRKYFEGNAPTIVRQDLAIRGLAFHPRSRVLLYSTGLRKEDAPVIHSKPGLVAWDLDARKPILTIPTKTNGFNSPAYSPDGTLVAAIEDDPKALASIVRVWDAATGEQRLVWSRSMWLSSRIAIAPDNTWLAVAGTSVGVQGNQGAIVIRPFDRSEAEIRLELDGFSQLSDLAITRDGRKILAPGAVALKPRVCIWERTGEKLSFQETKPLEPLEETQGGFDRVALSRDGRFVAASGGLGEPGQSSALVWELENRSMLGLRVHPSPTIPIGSLALDDDGSTLVLGLDDGTIVQSRFSPSRWSEPQSLHTKPIRSVAFLPGTTALATGSEDGTIRLSETDEERESRELDVKLELPHIAFQPDGTTLAVAGWRGQVGEIQFRSLDPPHSLIRTDPVGNRLLGIESDPTGRWLAVYGGAENRYGFVELRSWDDPSKTPPRPLPGTYAMVSDVKVAGPSGEWLVTAGRDAVRFWNLERGEVRFQRAVEGGFYFALASTPARHPRSLVAGVANVRAQGTGRLTVWDAATGDVAFELQPPRSIYQSPAFTSDGRHLAVTEAQGMDSRSLNRVLIYRTDTWSKVLELPGGQMGVRSLVYNSDGSRLATFGVDGLVRLWDTEYGIEVLTLPGKNFTGGWIAFSPDGRWLATAQRKVKLFDSGPREPRGNSETSGPNVPPR
ncbi:MAG: WD40 repeat domain-containing serine/threonine-protein kinase [Isosphaeraceae bacterium]